MGVDGFSSSGQEIVGGSYGAYGVLGSSRSSSGVHGDSGAGPGSAGVSGTGSNATLGTRVAGTSLSTKDGKEVWAYSTGLKGQSSSGVSVEGASDSGPGVRASSPGGVVLQVQSRVQVQGSALGTTTLPAGSVRTAIITSAATANSLVLLTPYTDPVRPVVRMRATAGSFTICTSAPVGTRDRHLAGLPHHQVGLACELVLATSRQPAIPNMRRVKPGEVGP
jgi:hypothetical protein